MKFTLEINCDNAAFEDFPEQEISRILTEAAMIVEVGGSIVPGSILRDINGNTVGSFKTVQEHESRRWTVNPV